MHEIRLVKKIIETAKQQGAKKSIILEVGELAELMPHEIEETLKEFTNWQITINEKESKIKCSCGYVGKAQILEREHDFCIFQCPQCQNKKPTVVEGGEIKIKGVA